jgi:hypothetical protein
MASERTGPAWNLREVELVFIARELRERLQSALKAAHGREDLSNDYSCSWLHRLYRYISAYFQVWFTWASLGIYSWSIGRTETELEGRRHFLQVSRPAQVWLHESCCLHSWKELIFQSFQPELTQAFAEEALDIAENDVVDGGFWACSPSYCFSCSPIKQTRPATFSTSDLSLLRRLF